MSKHPRRPGVSFQVFDRAGNDVTAQAVQHVPPPRTPLVPPPVPAVAAPRWLCCSCGISGGYFIGAAADGALVTRAFQQKHAHCAQGGPPLLP